MSTTQPAKIWILYRITNLVNGKVYLGRTERTLRNASLLIANQVQCVRILDEPYRNTQGQLRHRTLFRIIFISLL